MKISSPSSVVPVPQTGMSGLGAGERLPEVASAQVAATSATPASIATTSSTVGPVQGPLASPSAGASSAEVRRSVAELKQTVQAKAPDLQFSIDEETDRVVVKVTDAETKEVIRQIPSENVLRLGREIERMQGLLFDDKA